MIPIDSIRERLSRLDSSLRVLREIASVGRNRIAGDRVYLGAAKFYLIEAIQICLDIGNAVIGRMGWEKPSSYANVFAILSRHGLLSTELAQRLSKMAAFRNRLVHSYMDFDDSVLLSILQSDIDDIVEFAKAIDLKVLGVS